MIPCGVNPVARALGKSITEPKEWVIAWTAASVFRYAPLALIFGKAFNICVSVVAPVWTLAIK
jgi:hypothetical protein